ncbi:MAG: IS110 family transposase [Acidimicrobiales bacterium]
MLAEVVDVVIGVDTHKHTNTAAVVAASTGAVIDSMTACTDLGGHQALLEFAGNHGGLRVWAIEGANGYGAGLARCLAERGEWVVELDRPKRANRRHGAKSDPIDAVRAAREALSREHLSEPRSDGERQALAVRLAARRLAVDSSTDTQRQIHGLVVVAPEQLRSKLRGKTTAEMLKICSRLRVDPRWDVATRETALVLRCLARRAINLAEEAREHERAILHLVRAWRPDLLDNCGVGPIVAATVLCAWSHPGRVRSDAAFAMLAGTAPIPASSGMTIRYRLNRSGDRRLNQAIHTVVVTRMRVDPETRAYVERRRAEGKTDREIKRCLKRYVTRQLFRQLEHHTA